MRSPDEIKKGLEHCINGTSCRGCPYCEECAIASDCNPMQKDLQDYIQQLEAEAKSTEQIRWERDIAIGQLKKLGLSLGEKVDGKIPRWISVKESLPEKTGNYLTVIDCDKGRWVEVNTFDAGVFQWAHDLYHGVCIEDATPFVTHWMPLPETPKEEA